MNIQRIIQRTSAMFVVGGALGAVVAFPSNAEAKHQRYSSAFCYPSSSGGSNVFAQLNDSNTINNTVVHGFQLNADLVCPIIDTDFLPHTSVKTLNVHGENLGGVSSQAKACFTTFGGNGGGCTAPQNGAGTNFTISFVNASGVFSGSGSSDFVYLFVRLGNPQIGPARLRGYFTADT